MKDLIEALNRAAELDDSAKKPLTESAKGDAAKKLEDAARSVKCRLTTGFKRYALETPDYVDNIIEDELLYCGNVLCKEFPNMKYWKFGEKSKLTDMYGNYCVVETGTDEGKILVQLDGHGRIYHLEESINQLAEEDDEELEEDIVAKDFNSAKMLGIAEFKKLILSNKVKPFGDNSYCFGEGSTVDRVGGDLDRRTNTIYAWYKTKVYGKQANFDERQVEQQEATLRKVLESEGWKIDKFKVYTYSTKTFGRPATAGEVIIEANKLVNIDAGASSMDFESIIINAYNSASEWGKNYFNEWQTFVSCVSRSSEYKPSLTNTWIVPWVRVLTDDFKAPTIQFKTTTAASAERIAKVLKQYYPSVAVHHNRWYRGYLDSIIIATNEGNVELDVDPDYEKDIRPGHGTLNVANLKIGGKEIGRIN